MIIDHRTYTVNHGKMDDYLKRYENEALPLQNKYLGRLIGFFVNETGTMNQVTHLWAFDSMADREQRRGAMWADPAWLRFSSGIGGTFAHQDVRLMRPVSFSPLR
jgi:hypothetical protein